MLPENKGKRHGFPARRRLWNRFTCPLPHVRQNCLLQPFGKNIVRLAAFTVNADMNAVCLENVGEGRAGKLATALAGAISFSAKGFDAH